MRRAIQVGLVLLAGVALVAGCGKDEGEPGGPAKVTAPKTPKDTLMNMVNALKAADKKAFMDAVHVPQDATPAVEAMFETMAIMMDFTRAMEKEYGQEALAGRGPMSGAKMLDFDESKLQVKVEGDTATATIPDEKEPIKLVKKDGKWKVDLSDQMPPPDQRKEMIEGVAVMKKAVGAARGKIGKEGYTAEKVMQEFMAEMMKAAMQKGMGG